MIPLFHYYTFTGFDPAQDTPVEILHTFLLGIVKYYWSETVSKLNQSKSMQTFRERLASVNESGLNLPKMQADYITRYSGALIGKHFKSLVQIMPFILYALVNKDLIKAWSILGRLGVLIWTIDIFDLESYVVSESHKSSPQ